MYVLVVVFGVEALNVALESLNCRQQICFHGGLDLHQSVLVLQHLKSQQPHSPCLCTYTTLADIIHSVALSPSYQGVEVFPGVHQAVHAFSVPIVKVQLVFVEQSKGFFHWTDCGIDTNLRLPNLKQ